MARPEVFEINDFGNPLLDNGGVSQFGITPIDDTILSQDSVLGGGGTAITTNIFVLNISSNETGFSTLVNGEIVPNNKVVRITRDSLLTESKKIEIQKEGFTTNEYYIIEMLNDASPVIVNPKFEQPLGITTKDVTITKYVNNTIQSGPTSIKNSVSSELLFNLNKKLNKVDEEVQQYTLTFKISGKGLPVSIIKNGNKSAEFFPSVGVSSYEDIDGTKYIIRSSDLSLYRVSSINFSGLNAPKNLVANRGESLEVSITLSSDYIIDIITEEVVRDTPSNNPRIELLKTEARTYNINSKAGVPLMFRKNSNVKTITVIVGDDILEFDNLDKGDLCGITIPASVFKNIGKYNIKIFPFSLDDYESEVRPKVPTDIVESKPIEVKYDTTEIVETITPTVNDVYNPYSPTIGGGGSRPVFIDSLEENLNRVDSVSSGVFNGSFVNRGVDNLNIR